MISATRVGIDCKASMARRGFPCLAAMSLIFGLTLFVISLLKTHDAWPKRVEEERADWERADSSPRKIAEVEEGAPFAVVLMIHNESQFLAEFIEHYIAEGAKLFIVYEVNDSPSHQETTAKALAPFIERKLVHFISEKQEQVGSKRRMKNSFYNQVARPLLLAAGTLEWALFVDADEYAYGRNGLSLAQAFQALAHQSENENIICIPRKSFTTMGALWEPKCIVPSHVLRHEISTGEHMHTKCAHRIRDDMDPTIYGTTNPQSSREIGSEDWLDEQLVHLNHYGIRSLEQFYKTRVLDKSGDGPAMNHRGSAAQYSLHTYQGNQKWDVELSAKLHWQGAGLGCSPLNWGNTRAEEINVSRDETPLMDFHASICYARVSERQRGG